MIEKIRQTILNELHKQGIYTHRPIRRVEEVIDKQYNIPKKAYTVAGYEQLNPFKEYKIIFQDDIGQKLKNRLEESPQYRVENLENDEFRVQKVKYQDGEKVYQNLGVINYTNSVVYLDFVTRIEDSDFKLTPRSKRTLSIFEAYFDTIESEET